MLRTLFASCAIASTLLFSPTGPVRHAGELPPGYVPPAPAVAEEAPPPKPTFPTRRTQIGVPENNPLELYPPVTPSLAQPLILALHGKDQDPVDLCEAWNEEGRAQSWLLCPAGNTDGAESFDWGGTNEDRIAALDAQVAAVESVYGPLVDHDRGDVLVGFSRGAFLARDLLYAGRGRFTGLVLIGAALKLDPERLKAAGVKRVLLAAGEYDEARPTMQYVTNLLAARGVSARFVGLGPIYHRLPDNLGKVMHDALRWVREPVS